MKKIKIPIFKLKFDLKFKLKFIKGVWDILSSDRPLGESKYVKEFEDKFSNLVGSQYAVACSNGTTALELALKTIDVKGKKVLLPSNTFFATSVAVENSGGELLLVEMESESFSLDYDDLKNKIETNENIGAVIIVHIGGIISHDIKRIVTLCRKHKIPLIEDAAHAQGSYFNNFTAGTIGDMACFSFFPTKVMTTGEGGMVTTNKKKYYETIKSLKNFGRDNNDSGIIVNPHGNNFKINEFTGLMGSLECDRVLSRIQRRNDLIQRYKENLKDSYYELVEQKNGRCSYYKCILISEYTNTELKKWCHKHKVSLTGEVYKLPIHEQPLYKNMNNIKLNLSNTEYYSKHHICPPLYPELTFDEVDYVCDILKNYEKQNRKIS